MNTRKPLIAANWKMNGDLTLLKSLLSLIDDQAKASDVDVLVCPAFTMFSAFNELNNGDTKLGAQNVSEFDSGAYTGEISNQMLLELSCEYVLLGHSERRELFAETNQVIAEKFIKSAKQGLLPVLCIGETLEERESGATEKVLKEQLSAVIALSSAQDWQGAVIAYEPVWAIGTGKTATSAMAQETHQFIRGYLAENQVTADIAEKIRILYGGSMKPENAAELIAQPDIDGGLVGGASLSPDSFVSIINAAG